MIVNILKTLSDVNRLRILNLLNQRALCVCELEYLLEINQSNLSRHLKNMSQLGILETWRENKFVYYRMDTCFMDENAFIKEIVKRFSEEAIFQDDLKRYQTYLQEEIPCECITGILFEKKLRQRG